MFSICLIYNLQFIFIIIIIIIVIIFIIIINLFFVGVKIVTGPIN